MTRYLPIVLLLAISCFLLSAVPSFAIDIIPTVTSSPQQSKDAWENFKNLFILDSLPQVNCSSLPLDACSDFKPQTNTEVIANTAGQYVIASGIRTPPELADAKTNVVSDFVANIVLAFGSIFDTGEKQAKNYAGSSLPQDVTDKNFAQGVQNISGHASENSNVLGVQFGNFAMDRAFPLVQCAGLPKRLCSKNNIPNFINK